MEKQIKQITIIDNEPFLRQIYKEVDTIMLREERKKCRQKHGYKIYSKTGDYS